MEKYLWELNANDYASNQETIDNFNTCKTKVIDLINKKEEIKLRDFVDKLIEYDNTIYDIFNYRQLQKNRFVNILKS